jgi:endoglycosylceramidase
MFEPSVLFSASGRGAPPRFTRERNVVYAPHIYTGGFSGGPISRQAFATVRGEARALGGVPVLSGEWGADPDRAGARGDGYFLDHQALQDEFGFGATLWTWRESCGDPHKVGDLRAGRVPEVWGLWEVDCRNNSVKGMRRALAGELRRGWVRAAPGRLRSMSWDPARGRLKAAGRSRRSAGRLVAFVPGRRVAARVSGLRGLRIAHSPGGAIVLARPRGGAWALSVRAR